MRDVDNRLDSRFESLRTDLVQHEGENYRNGKTQNKAVDIKEYRIDDETLPVIGTKKIPEVLEADPGAAHHTPAAVVVSEGYLDSIHGDIAKEEYIKNPRSRAPGY
jgi:hypothetical protein